MEQQLNMKEMVVQYLHTIQHMEHIKIYMKHQNFPVANFCLKNPQSMSEQQAIATILTDMDDEIQALEAKRDKYTAIKQGMMSLLRM